MIVWSKIQKPCGKYECTFPTSIITKRVISTQVLLMKCTRNVTTSIKSKLFWWSGQKRKGHQSIKKYQLPLIKGRVIRPTPCRIVYKWTAFQTVLPRSEHSSKFSPTSHHVMVREKPKSTSQASVNTSNVYVHDRTIRKRQVWPSWKEG